MTEINPLVCVLSPRDISLVKAGHDTFKHVPHLWLKYWKACQAYKIIEDFFKENTEFTHVVIAPDDLVVRKEHYDKLAYEVEKGDFPVLGGVCNINTLSPKTLAICIDELPSIIRRERASRTGRKYHYAQVDNLPSDGVIQVKFAGMPFLFIRRDVVEQVGFTGDTIYDETRKHMEPRVFDLAFCYECNQKNIPIHVNTNVRLLHLNGPMDGDPELMKQIETNKVGKVEPKVFYQVGDDIQDFTKEYQKLIYNLNQYETKYIVEPYL